MRSLWAEELALTRLATNKTSMQVEREEASMFVGIEVSKKNLDVALERVMNFEGENSS
jgi:hypothetical protein